MFENYATIMKRTEETTAKHLSFTASSLHFLQRKAFVLPLCSGRRRGLSFALLLAVLWLVGIPVGAKSITIVSPQPNVVAAADTSMVAYTEKKTRTKIPSAYKDKIDSVLKENLPVIELNGTNSWSFTTDIVIKEMESDWGISKDNQLLFIWNIISKQLAGDYIYDGEDGVSNRLEEYRTVVRTARSCGKRYKDGIMPFIEKKVAENKQKIAEKDRQIAENKQKIAEKDRQIAENKQKIAENKQKIAEKDLQIAEKDLQIAENKLVSFTNSINKYNDFINKYSKNLDPNMVKEALNIISEYNLKIGEFKKRAENLATQLNNQHLSASEIESIKNMAGQLCSDIDTQRNAMHKKRIAIVEKANDVVEKKKAEVQQKVAGFDDTNVNPNDSPKKSINKVNETIAKFKKSIEEAKTNNDEDKLSEAEDWQLIASNYLQIAEKDLQIAENKQKIAEKDLQIAENNQQIAEDIKKIMRLDSIGIKNMVSFYQKRDKITQYETNKLKEDYRLFLEDCKIREIDPIKILLAEVKVKYPNLKEAEARRKVDEILKYWK